MYRQKYNLIIGEGEKPRIAKRCAFLLRGTKGHLSFIASKDFEQRFIENNQKSYKSYEQ